MGIFFFFLQPVSVSIVLLHPQKSLRFCTDSGLALQTLALKGQTYLLDSHALQLFLQHFLQDGAKLLQEVWVSPQGFQQPLLPAPGGLLPVWSKGGCWYQCSDGWAMPWGRGWWDPSPLWAHGSHQSQSKQLVALSRLRPSTKG